MIVVSILTLPLFTFDLDIQFWLFDLYNLSVVYFAIIYQLCNFVYAEELAELLSKFHCLARKQGKNLFYKYFVNVVVLNLHIIIALRNGMSMLNSDGFEALTKALLIGVIVIVILTFPSTFALVREFPLHYYFRTGYLFFDAVFALGCTWFSMILCWNSMFFLIMGINYFNATTKFL